MATACTGEITRLINGSDSPPKPEKPPLPMPLHMTAGIATR